MLILSKYYQNITISEIVFGIHFKFDIVLPIRLEI